MQTVAIAFSAFLTRVKGQKDVSLVIAKNTAEKKLLQTTLTKGRIPFRVLSEHTDKEAYDFAAQYPTGQIETFDPKAMRSSVESPDYSKPFIFLATNADLARMKRHGFDFLSKVGLAYRTPV